jgi:general secretion pathway protein A
VHSGCGKKTEAVDLLTYWRLNERPFEPTWDTRFFFEGREHDEALSRLGFLVSEQTMLLGMLTGEIGCGKTLTRAVFTDQLQSDRFCVVTQENSSFRFNDLLELVLRAVDGEPPSRRRGKLARYESFLKIIERLAAEKRHLVLIFDEAQEMSPATLNELKQLTNLNRAGKSLLTVILVGQPELRERVARLPAINQRISLRFHLNPLSRPEAGDYLRHRLKAAGHASGELFSPEAVDRAYEASQGVPRELNRIAKLALEFAWVQEYPEVNSIAVDAVVHDLRKHQNLPQA